MPFYKLRCRRRRRSRPVTVVVAVAGWCIHHRLRTSRSAGTHLPVYLGETSGEKDQRADSCHEHEPITRDCGLTHAHTPSSDVPKVVVVDRRLRADRTHRPASRDKIVKKKFRKPATERGISARSAIDNT